MKHFENTLRGSTVLIAANQSTELPLLRTVWIVLAILLSTFTAKSQINSIAPTNWNTQSTWDCTCVPGAGDDVVIHHAVLINSGINTARSVIIINDAFVNASLQLTGGTTTIGNGGITVRGEATTTASDLVLANAILRVNGDLKFINRITGNNAAALRVTFNSQLTVTGNLTYNYEAADGVQETTRTEIAFENTSIVQINGEIILAYNSATKNSTLSCLIEHTAAITVGGNVNLISTETGSNTGDTRRVHMAFGTSTTSASSIVINGNLNITNNDISAPSAVSRNMFETRDNVSVTVRGDLNMTTLTTTVVSRSNRLRILDDSTLTLEGDLVFSSATGSVGDNRPEIGNAGSDAIFDIKGNVLNPGQGRIESGGNASFVFSGSIAQRIPIVFPNYVNIIVDNSSGIPLTLAANTSINGNLEMNNGIINSVSPDRLILNDAATSNGGTSTSYVVNGLTKLGRSNITLPIGAGTRWAPLRLANIVGGDQFFTNFEVNYTGSGHPDPSCTLDPIIDHISGSEYWTIETTGTIPTSMDVTFYWKDACRSQIEDITTFPRDLYIAGYWVAGVWVVPPSSVIDVGSLDCSTAPYTGGITASLNSAFLTMHSDYAFAAVSAFVNPLPVELLSFEVEEDAFKEVIIKWETVSELNSWKFVVEKSRDGKSWDAISQLEALGTSSVGKKYSITDLHPYSSTTYYRLAQFDLDGSVTFSSIRSLTLGSGHELTFSYYPNPVKDILHINSGKQLSSVDVVIVNTKGSTVLRHHFPEFSWRQSILLNDLNAGLYYITLLEKGRKLSSDAIVINQD